MPGPREYDCFENSRCRCSPGTELLLGLERQEIDVILAAARLRRLRASSVITHQGDPADQLFLLWKGRARYFVDTPNGKKLILIWVTPGHIFGAAALAAPPSTYLASTEAVCSFGMAQPFAPSPDGSLGL
jgi:CRP/FNR family transcriptional regulator, nitrogen oxide reductase regulator